MAKSLKLKRGSTSEHSGYTGPEGEITIDTDKETAVVHDNSTAGGHPLAKTVTTTRGDIVIRATNTDARLAAGTPGHYLKMGSNEPEWAAVASSGASVESVQRVERDIAMLAFYRAADHAKAKFNLVDQAIDHFVDTTGVDTGACTNLVHDSSNDTVAGGAAPTITVNSSGTVPTTGTNGNYTWYKYVEDGTFQTSDTGMSVDYLMIGGGGGSGYTGHDHEKKGYGGGGAGGFRYGKGCTNVGTNAVSITVGNAGGSSGGTGNNTVFGTIDTANGGGGGGTSDNNGGNNGSSGGCGGGGGSQTNDGGGYSGGGANQAISGGSGGSGKNIDDTEGKGGGGGGGQTGNGGSASGNAGSGSGGAGGNGITEGTTTCTNSVDGNTTVTIDMDGSGMRFGGGGGGHVGNGYSWGNSTGSGSPGTGGQNDTTSPHTGWGHGGSPSGGGGGDGAFMIRYEGGLSGAGGDLTLQSNDTTSTVSNPTDSDIVVLIENQQGTATINTDLKAYVSNNSGSNWVQATLVDGGSWGTNKKIYYAHDVDISGTTGTSMTYKITTHNQAKTSKETVIHAVSHGWHT